MYSYAGMGVIGLLGFVSPTDANLMGIVAMVVIPLLVSLVLGMAIYKDSDYDYLEGNNSGNTDTNKKEKTEDKKILNVKETILMPMDGTIKALSESEDDAFASEALGKGCVIVPDNGDVCSPVNGEIKTIFPTKHAIGILSDDGCEILIHIGINTVSLEGKYFESHVKAGDKVEAGQLLVSFEKENIEKEGYSCEIPVIITNTFDYLDVRNR